MTYTGERIEDHFFEMKSFFVHEYIFFILGDFSYRDLFVAVIDFVKEPSRDFYSILTQSVLQQKAVLIIHKEYFPACVCL